MIWLTKRYFDQRLDALVLVLQRNFKLMAQSIQDLDASLDDFDQGLADFEAEIQAAVDDMAKKSSADVTAEVQRIQAAKQKLKGFADAIRGQDTP